MLRFTHKTTADSDQTLTLSYESRQKSRQRVVLDNGMPAGLFLERGIILREGDCLQTDDGETVKIRAAREAVSTVYCNAGLQMARACYHLGNRHVALQITEKFIRFQADHVLNELCHGLGLKVQSEDAPFEPESGAYGDYGHMQGHSHLHANSHSHEHGKSHKNGNENDH